MKYYTLNFIAKLISLIPLKIWFKLSFVIAYTIRKTKIAKIASTNLNQVYLSRTYLKIKPLKDTVLVHSIYTFFEIIVIWFTPKQKLKKKILKEIGLSHFKNAINSQKPIIILCPHLGNWEFVGYWLNLRGYTMTIMYQMTRFQTLNKLMLNRRCRLGNQLAPTNRAGIKTLLKELKNNQVIGILPDQVPPQESDSVKAHFMNAKAYTLTLVHKFLQKTDATVLVISALRENHKGFNIYISDASSIKQQTVLESTNKMNDIIEQHINISPHQYQWCYKRFRYIKDINYP